MLVPADGPGSGDVRDEEYALFMRRVHCPSYTAETTHTKKDISASGCVQTVATDETAMSAPPSAPLVGRSRFVRGIQRRIEKMPDDDSMDLTLLDDICQMHARIRLHAPARASADAGQQATQYLAMYGFGNNEKKVVAMRALRYAVGPALLHGSTVSDGRWEAMVMLGRWRPAAIDLENLLVKFRMSIGVIDLETYMGASMLACYERIEQGRMVFGSMLLSRNLSMHQHLQQCLHNKQEQEKRLQMEQVVGMPLSVQSMWAMHHSLQNSDIEATILAQSVRDVRRHVVDVLVIARVVSSLVEHAEFVEDATLPHHTRDVLQMHLRDSGQILENVNESLLRIAGSTAASSPRAPSFTVYHASR